MRVVNILTISIILLVILTQCGTRTSTHENSLVVKDSVICNIYNPQSSFQDSTFPFSFKGFKINEVKKYFKTDVTIDSIEFNNEGYISKIYKFKDHLSEINLFVNINDGPDAWFYLENSQIKSDILTLRNGIKIGMNRTDFFKSINMTVQPCDTFLIREGDMAMYFYCIFKDNQLKLIDIEAPE